MRTAKDFAVAVGRFRVALLTASGLGAGERQIGLLMLEAVNRKEFIETGKLESWLGEKVLAVDAELHASQVRRARAGLLRHAIIATDDRKGGRGKSTRYRFSFEWLANTETKLANRRADGLRPPEERGANLPPLDTTERGANTRPIENERGAFPIIKGRISDQERGANTRPDLLDRNHLKDLSEIEGASAPHRPEGGSPCDRVVQAWNEMAKPLGFPGVQTKITDARRKLITARLSDAGGVDGLKAAFEKIAASPFLRGERSGPEHSNWKVSFDWVLKESNFVKLVEGNYDEAPGATTNQQRRGLFAAIADEIRREEQQ
jgi:hypothetical protein